MKVDLDEIEASLGYVDDWYKLIKELRAARKVVEAARNYFTEHDLEGLSRKFFKSYYAVKDALKDLEGDK